MDSRFRVEVMSKTENPQQLIYAAMHQDYSEGFVYDEIKKFPNESRCGEIAVKRLLEGGRAHWGCTEFPAIAFNCGYFPHSVIQQATRHRINTTFDVQSNRYTSQRFIDCAEGKLEVEEVFYLRPVGYYTDRQGSKYYYSPEQRSNHLSKCKCAAIEYKLDIESGMSEEHARGLIPFDFRQHFMVGYNLRSLLHFLDLRSKKDAQLEIQQLCELLWLHTRDWVPEIAEWYERNRLHKAKLAP